MISRRRAFFVTVTAMIMTFILAYMGSLYFGIKLDQKVVLSAERYEALRQIEEKYEKYEYVQDYILNNFLYDTEETRLYDGGLEGMLATLGDPYSEYMTIDEFESLIEQTQGEYSGIGVYVSVSEDNKIVVVAPIEDTPAEKAGLKTGDYIIAVNGIPYSGDELSDAVSVMKGKPGTDVSITISRTTKDNVESSFEVVITRQNIKIATIKYEMLEEKIGYIRITTFDQLTADDFILALKELVQQNMKGLIVDVRYNPGGLIHSVAEIADELLGETIITYTQTKNGEREYYYSKKSQLEVPLVLLINEGSASASEILAGAVKDTGAGVLVGTQTFGKGIVQRIMPLEDGSGVKLTVSEYFTPNDINIHGVGISPDVTVALPEDAMYGPEYLEEDLQLQRAIEIIRMK